MNEYHYAAGIFIARTFLGVLFLIQGYDKVLNIGIKKVILSFKTQLQDSVIPPPLVTTAAYYSSYVELFGGMLLILGLMKYAALYALGFDLILVAVAMGIIEPLWRMDYVFPRLALILLLLLAPSGADLFSIDQYLTIQP